LERKAARKPAAAAKPKILLEGDLDVDDSKNSKIAHKTAWKAMKSSVMMKSTTWTQRYFILWTDKLQVFSSKSEIRAVPLSTLSLKGRTVKGDGKESKEKRFRISLSESGAGADDGVEMGTKDIKQHKKWADALKGALECLQKAENGQEGESGGEMTSSSGLDLEEEEEEAVEEGAGLKGVLDVDVHVRVLFPSSSSSSLAPPPLLIPFPNSLFLFLLSPPHLPIPLPLPPLASRFSLT
jgi:hypothetical protein